MDQVSLQQKAETLEAILVRHASENTEAAALLSALMPTFRVIRWGLVKGPFEWQAIPGSYYFSEGSLRDLAELSEAYASFKVELAGLADHPLLQRMREHGPPSA